MADDLKPDDVIVQRDGPFISNWRVAAVGEVGATLRYIEGTVAFIGFEHPVTAPGGAVLTTNLDTGFLGRAHFAAAVRLGDNDG